MLKKRYLLFGVVLIISVILLSSYFIKTQSESDTTILGTNLVKYNLEGIEEFGFNVNLVTGRKDADVEFVSFEGENTQGLAVRLADDTYDELKDYKYNRHYIRLLGFICNTGDDYVRIDSVTLKINGEQLTYQFKDPIVHKAIKEETDTEVSIRTYPLFISTNSYKTTKYEFNYYVNEDIVMQNFLFNDFLIVKDAVIYINGDKKGKMEELLPLEISKDSEISIKCFLDLKDKDNSTKYDSIYNDSVFSYIEKGDTKIKECRNNLVSQSVSNKEDGQKVIEMLLKQ